MTPWRISAVSRSRTAKLLSPSSTTSRPGSHRRACQATRRAQSVSVLCRRPRSWQERSDGASTVGKGKAQTRPAHGIGLSSIRLSKRSTLDLTKNDHDECDKFMVEEGRYMQLIVFLMTETRKS